MSAICAPKDHYALDQGMAYSSPEGQGGLPKERRASCGETETMSGPLSARTPSRWSLRFGVADQIRRVTRTGAALRPAPDHVMLHQPRRGGGAARPVCGSAAAMSLDTVPCPGWRSLRPRQASGSIPIRSWCSQNATIAQAMMPAATVRMSPAKLPAGYTAPTARSRRRDVA